jgi:hypothetical protein
MFSKCLVIEMFVDQIEVVVEGVFEGYWNIEHL